MSHTVIVGAGLAGLTVARELRALRPDVAITVVTADDGHHYPKPQLSSSLRTGKLPEALIGLRAETLLERNITLVARAHVSVIDAVAQSLTLDDGRVLTYDTLVLAVGASPFVPPMAGEADHVLTVNHLDDYRRFRERLTPEAPVLVIGGGLIGMEFTADLLSQGHAVHVVDPGPGPLPRLLPPGAAGLLTQALGSAGAHFYWGCTVTRLEGAPGDFTATLSDGRVLKAAVVLSAVGLRPQIALAQGAGLPVGRGVLVDATLRAAPAVYAVGDCAELPGGVYLPFIKPIGEQAKYVARAIAGERQGPFAPGNYVIAVKVPQWAVMSTTPLPAEAGVWEEELTPTGSLSKLHAPDGRLLRVVATGQRAAELRDWLGEVPTLAEVQDLVR